jgi:hypothetical protein
VVHEKGVHGERFYRCTVSGLEVIYAEGDIVSLPEDYKDPINPDQPSINHESTIQSTIKTNNSNNNIHTNQPNSEVCSDGELDPVLNEGNIAMPGKMVDKLIRGQTIANGIVDSWLIDGISPNKGPIKVESTILRFLKPVPAFVAEDLKTYGPFHIEDVATVPKINAKGLISKEFALPVTPGRASV